MTRRALTRATLALLLFFSASCSRHEDRITVVASKWAQVFHSPTCEWAGKISDINRRSFKTVQEALDAGLRPCKVCRHQITGLPALQEDTSAGDNDPIRGGDSDQPIKKFDKLN